MTFHRTTEIASAPIGQASAPLALPKSEQTIRFDDGDETVSVRITEWTNRTYTAVDVELPGTVGSGFTSIGACADLFEKLPRARSEREERDMMAERFDHARDLRKHAE